MISLDWPEGLWRQSELRQSRGIIYVRGYAFQGEKFFKDDAIAEFLSRCCQDISLEETKTKIRELVPTLNGCWAIVTAWSDGQILAACDRVRSIPLFYSQQPGGILLSSSIYPIVDKIHPDISILAAEDYLLVGHVTRATLFMRACIKSRPVRFLSMIRLMLIPVLKPRDIIIFFRNHRVH